MEEETMSLKRRERRNHSIWNQLKHQDKREEKQPILKIKKKIKNI